MEKGIKLSMKTQVAAVCCGLLAINLVSALCFDYPVLYCAFGNAAAALYMQWGSVILYVLVVYTIYQLFQGGVKTLLISALIYVAIMQLPILAVYLFRPGGSCG